MTTMKVIRILKDVSQAELAALARITRSRISRIESGADTPYKPEIGRLCGALGIPPESLLRTVDVEALRAVVVAK